MLGLNTYVSLWVLHVCTGLPKYQNIHHSSTMYEEYYGNASVYLLCYSFGIHWVGYFNMSGMFTPLSPLLYLDMLYPRSSLPLPLSEAMKLLTYTNVANHSDVCLMCVLSYTTPIKASPFILTSSHHYYIAMTVASLRLFSALEIQHI